ncbi:MAG: hypothetical protein IPH07_24665 [Deltaproteobacteria bacterium]|nr:hypothetical protein [Deltaproteobacteria bacterium]
MAKKTVGELVFEMRAEVAQLRRDMGEAKSIAKRGVDDIEAAFKTLRRGIEIALGGTLITALTKAFTSAVHDLASLKGAAETAGTSVENLSRTLGVAVEAGIGVEKVVSIVTKLNQSILAAQTSKRAESAWGSWASIQRSSRTRRRCWSRPRERSTSLPIRGASPSLLSHCWAGRAPTPSRSSKTSPKPGSRARG